MVDSFSLVNDGNKDDKNLIIVENKMNIDNIENKSIGIVKEQTQTEEASSSTSNSSPLLSSLLQLGKSSSVAGTTANGQKYEHHYSSRLQGAIMGAKGTNIGSNSKEQQSESKHHLLHHHLHHLHQQNHEEASLMTQQHLNLKSPEKAASSSSTTTTTNGSPSSAATHEAIVNLTATTSELLVKDTLISNNLNNLNNNNNNNKLQNCYESVISSDNNKSNNNNNNNLTVAAAASSSNNNNNNVSYPPKSILENCLLKPSSVKLVHQHESQTALNNNSKMEDNKQQASTNYYNASAFQASAADLSESRKVEPLKINLHRQPIRTVIKVPPASQLQPPPESPPKITIKPIKPPENEIIPKITIRPVVNTTVSPTLSSSSTSSLSSGSSMENLAETGAPNPGSPQKTIQVIPKLHIKNYTESLAGNCDASEPYLVPKLVLRSVPTTPTTMSNQKHASVIVNNTSSDSNAIDSNNVPKLTIKMDNHIGSANNGPGNHHHHHHFNSNSVKNQHGHHSQSVLSKEGVKLTIKAIPEPAVPKLTIKTDNENMFVATQQENNARCQSPIPKITIKSQQSVTVSPIPKVTIKPIEKPQNEQQQSVPKLNIKPIPVPRPAELEVEQEAIPKLTIKAVTNNNGADNSGVSTFEKVVPKLVVKLPPKEQQSHYGTGPGTESNSSSPSPSPPIVHKLNIKPIQPPDNPPQQQQQSHQLLASEKEPVPKIHIKLDLPEADKKTSNHKDGAADSVALSKFSIKSLIETTDSPYSTQKPLEINTTSNKSVDSGQDSPRIILKINKNSKETITTEIIPAAAATQQQQLSTSNSNNSSSPQPVIQVTPPAPEIPDKNHNDAPAATNAQNPSINSSNLVSNNSNFNNNNSNSNNSLVSGTKRTYPKRVEEAEGLDMDSEIPRKVIKVMPAVEDDVIVLDDDSNSMDPTTNEESVKESEEQEQEKEKEKEKEREKEKIPPSSKLEENQKNLSRILTRIQRQRKQEEEVDEKPTDKLQNLLILNDGEGSSNDCIMIQDDPLRIDRSENSQDTLPDDEVVQVKRLRGRPRKPEKMPKPAPIVKQPSIVISPIKLDKQGNKKIEKEEESSESDSESDSETQESNDTKSETNKSVPENNRVAAVKGRPRGRGRSKRTIEVIKDGKPVQITLDGHDDDDSPTFSIWNRSLRGSFGSRSKRGRGGRSGRGKRSVGNSSQNTPNRSRENSVFTTPHYRKQGYHASTPSLFEDDTLMSTGDCFQTPARMLEFVNNDDSQSSLFSSTGNTTVEGSSRKRGKMEVCEPEGRTEFTIEMLAEYEWPQQHPSRESYMIQEQIAEYLGVKSFKRKYPDLMRRPVDMEERNFLYENGLASEKMCDLGLTAVFASEILDIMCNDYPDKYEEYKRYQREKQFCVRAARFREPIDKGQLQKDKAIQSASNWNTQFNKDRKENRRCCMDLQNLIVQKPKPTNTKENATRPVSKSENYPVALVPGQFADNFVKYTPEQLACYPINTVLVDYQRLERYLATHPNPYESSESEDSSDDEAEKEGSDKESSSSASSDSEDSSSGSEDEEMEDTLCKVCSQTKYSNKFSKPEQFIKCASCKNEAHPSCIEMSNKMYKRCLEYYWKCADCKTCSKCKLKRDNKMLFCDQCDRGYHIYCLGLRNVPEGRWHCDICTICTNCGTKNPEGHPNPSLTHQQRQELSMIAHWTHEYTTNKLTNIREHLATLCVPCGKQYKAKSLEEQQEK